MANLAIFDLDYTLTKRGTWGRFVLRSIKSKPLAWLPFIFSTIKAQSLYKMGKTPRVTVKQAMMRWSLVGAPKEDVVQLADSFAQQEVQNGFRPGAWKALEHHRANGDTIIIASAAVCVIVEAIADRLDVDHWVATEMKWEAGRLAPDFASPNCYGAEKLNRVKNLLAEHPGLQQEDTSITVYSDSYADMDILRFADKAVAVNADAKLRQAAKAEGFELAEW